MAKQTVTKNLRDSIELLNEDYIKRDDEINLLIEQATQQIGASIIELELKVNAITPPVGSIIAVAIGTKMNTTYWQKVSMSNGFTLTNGTASGTTAGALQSHNHKLAGYVAYTAIKENWDVTDFDPASSVSYHSLCLKKYNTKIQEINDTVNAGVGANNLAAGYNVEFWKRIK